MTLTRDQLQRLTGSADRWADALNNALQRWSINTPERVAMFLAQCAHESSGFKVLTEDLHYSAARLLEVWPKRFTPEDAVRMAYDERAIAERAYGGRLGNAMEGLGDGHRFRGRGIIQLTGRDNYTRCGQAVGVDLAAYPEVLEQPLWAAISAGWFWATNGCNELADAGDYLAITRRINGGTNGQADREAWLATVRTILNAPAAVERPSESAIPSPAAPPAGGPSNQPKENDMGIALPLLAQILPQVLNLFSGRAQVTIAEKTGSDPQVAAEFMQSMIAQVGHAMSVPVVDNTSATQAVAALTALPAEAQAETVRALEAQALATVDALLKAGDKMMAWDAAKWDAEIKGKDAASARAIAEGKAGLWDMTRTLVTSLVLMLWGIAWGLGYALYEAIRAPEPNAMVITALIGLAGPIWTGAIVASVAAIVAYRFDGSKASSDQSRALINALPTPGART